MSKANVSANGEKFISNMTAYKRRLKECAKDLPVLEFKPLRSWPAAPHPEQRRIDAFNGLPSAYK